MDKALAQFRASPTAENRARVMELMDRDAPILPLIYGQSVAIYSRRVRGFRAASTAVNRMSFSKLDVTD
jgi:hypothetical protein